MNKLYFIYHSSDVSTEDMRYEEFEMYDILQDALDSADESEIIVELNITKTYSVAETKKATLLKDYSKPAITKKGKK